MLSIFCFWVNDTLELCGITVLVFEKLDNIKWILHPVAAIKWAGPVAFDIAPIAFFDNW